MKESFLLVVKKLLLEIVIVVEHPTHPATAIIAATLVK
jgi:hypothetical protein